MTAPRKKNRIKTEHWDINGVRHRFRGTANDRRRRFIALLNASAGGDAALRGRR